MAESKKKVLNNKFEYSVDDKLGSGSFAEVYKGYIINTGEEVAGKSNFKKRNISLWRRYN